ncbi:MAG: DegV family protein [Ardenticatenaceae bacterium]|nr:DegV family protein [Ardenticatenaceae bacterium]
MTTRILTDSTCDLPADLVDRYRIAVVPSYVNLKGQSLRDEIDLSRETFYRDLPTYDPYPTTASASPGEYATSYTQLAEEGADDIVAIHVAGSLSSILNASQNGADLAGVNAHLIDSGQLSLGLGFQVLAAAELAAQGVSAVEIKREIIALQKKIFVYALIDSLESLRRSGRVNWIQMRVGTLLQLKLILQVHQGAVEPIGRVRTRRKALKQLVEFGRSHGKLARLALINTNAPDLNTVSDLFSAFIDRHTKTVNAVGSPAIGVHVGPGAVAIAIVHR